MISKQVWKDGANKVYTGLKTLKNGLLHINIQQIKLSISTKTNTIR